MFIIQFMFNSSASIDLVFKELKNLKSDVNNKSDNEFAKKIY